MNFKIETIKEEAPPSDNKTPVSALNKRPLVPVSILTFILIYMKYPALLVFILLLACHSSQKVYQAPAVGAEAQFDRGLRPEKHPKYLFDKKTMKEMKEQGTVSTYSSKRRSTARTIPLPGKGANGKDSVAAPVDSLHSVTDSTKAPLVPADSTHLPVDTTRRISG
ncbi:hypothetical protein ACTJJ0_20310 [Chitinophaga sp. 22321]|uniref:Uncharacterized protein n=1 Tax=Chitinophaga hostae TaxID=2831022 RepID=A0ABS5J3L9_9BACT|nr:hypothetical protein [Chitinophaga hostae]MBS0029827.1 hypothetical protein [Chitinophaga hostae]